MRRTWILRAEHRGGALVPRDLVAFQVDDKVLYVQEEGTWDLASIDDGLPGEDMWDEVFT